MTRWLRRVRWFFRPRRRWRAITVPADSRTPPATQPYPYLIQDLNVVVWAATDALAGGVPDPPGLTLDDPSSPGPPSSWGTGILGYDPINDDVPITGVTDGSRNPGGPDSGGQVSAKKKRKGGSGRQSSKNTLTLVTSGAPHHCFQGQIVGTVTKPAPDPYGFNGTTPSFTGVLCVGYNPPVLTGPQTALTTRLSIASPYSPAGTALLVEIGHYLRDVVGSDSFLTVTSDLLSDGALTVSCSGQPCGSAPVPSVAGTGVGTIINAG